tara:strand:- start:6828 stop:7724 length:897 start_codon:yes stop_codon:yes gene_type:complete
MQNNETMTLFAFDMNSLFARVFTRMAPKNVMPKWSGAYLDDGTPVFCLRAVHNMVFNEIAAMRKLGVENTHIVLVFDHPGKNFRHEIFPQYKGNRPPKPEEWLIQEKLMYDMFVALGFNCLRIEGVEADDTLATLAVKLSEAKINVVMFTGDKDLMSLCNDYVSVYAGKDRKWWRAADVEAKFEVPTSRVIDYLAIDGDVADNVPGVAGAGKAAAIEILNTCSLQNVVDDPDLLLKMNFRTRKSVAKWVRENREKIELSQKLVSLKTDVVLGTNLNKMVRTKPDYEAFLNGYMRTTQD